MPVRIPAEYVIRRVPATPCAVLHRIVVSACHAVRSVGETPIFNDCVKSRNPMLAPCIVTLTEPVVAEFVRESELIYCESAENSCDTLPARPPTVSINFRLLATMLAAWHRIEVSESHADRSQALAPTLPDAVVESIPMLVPCKVTLDEPEAALFVRFTMLTTFKSTDIDRLTEPMRVPVVRLIRLLPIASDAAWHRNEVSEPQAVRSQLVTPTLSDCEYEKIPLLAPSTVKLKDPDDAQLCLKERLKPRSSALYAADMLPLFLPTVKTTLRLINRALLT